MPIPNLLTILTFVAGAVGVAGLYSFLADLFLRERTRINQRLDEEFRQRQRERVQRSPLFKDLAKLANASASALGNVSPRRRFEIMVEQSGLDINPLRLLTGSLGAGLVMGALAGLITGRVLVGLIVGLLSVGTPIIYVYIQRKWRLEKMVAQLPEAFELMARLIRSGQTITQAIQGVADEFKPPISLEFSYCSEQQNLGLPPDVALRDLAQRCGVLEIKIFVLGLLVQRQTGGNLAELLDNLGQVVRDRLRIRGVIKILTAEGRMQAAVLLAMPPVMLIVMMILNPDYVRVIFQYPKVLAGTLVSMALGAVWIRRIVNFDI